MATRRSGKPYFWVTWLAKILGGNECLWSVWFRGHYRYDKVEEMAGDLVEWNRKHNLLMVKRRRELEREGWSVTVEEANAFKLDGATAVVAGKPDIIARKDDMVLVVDGKTGRRREADIWQVFFYLFGIQQAKRELSGALLEGEVHYEQGDERISVTPAELTPARMDQIVSLIRIVAGPTPPPKAPSRYECERCTIGSADCPERVTKANDPSTIQVGAF